MALALAVVQGDLEEAPEVAECLLAFLFHYLLADDRITCLSQGAPRKIASSTHVHVCLLPGARCFRQNIIGL